MLITQFIDCEQHVISEDTKRSLMDEIETKPVNNLVTDLKIWKPEAINQAQSKFIIIPKVRDSAGKIIY